MAAARRFHGVRQPKFWCAILTLCFCKSLFLKQNKTKQNLQGHNFKRDIAATREEINWSKHASPCAHSQRDALGFTCASGVYNLAVRLLRALWRPAEWLTQLVGLMAAVDSAVGMNLEMEADANPTVEPASPASRSDLLLQKLALQRDVLCSGGGGGGANQVSDGQKVKRNIHSSKEETLARPLLAFWRRSWGLATRKPVRTHACSSAPGHYPGCRSWSCSAGTGIFITPMISLLDACLSSKGRSFIQILSPRCHSCSAPIHSGRAWRQRDWHRTFSKESSAPGRTKRGILRTGSHRA